MLSLEQAFVAGPEVPTFQFYIRDTECGHIGLKNISLSTISSRYDTTEDCLVHEIDMVASPRDLSEIDTAHWSLSITVDHPISESRKARGSIYNLVTDKCYEMDVFWFEEKPGIVSSLWFSRQDGQIFRVQLTDEPVIEGFEDLEESLEVDKETETTEKPEEKEVKVAPKKRSYVDDSEVAVIAKRMRIQLGLKRALGTGKQTTGDRPRKKLKLDELDGVASADLWQEIGKRGYRSTGWGMWTDRPSLHFLLWKQARQSPDGALQCMQCFSVFTCEQGFHRHIYKEHIQTVKPQNSQL